MANRTDQPPEQPSPAKQPNRIMSEPATVDACAQDLRTPDEQDTAAGHARDQLAHTREAAADQASAPGSRR